MKLLTRAELTFLALIVVAIVVLFKTTVSSKALFAPKKHRQAEQKPRDKISLNTERLSNSKSIQTLTPQKIIARTAAEEKIQKGQTHLNLKLQSEALESFAFLNSIEQREHDFLIYDLGLTIEQYNTIQDRRSQVQAQLVQIPQRAARLRVPADQLKKEILAKHVYWMQSAIGVGNYSLLQELSFNEQ